MLRNARTRAAPGSPPPKAPPRRAGAPGAPSAQPVANGDYRVILTVDGQKWKVEKVDDHAVRFTLPSRFAIFLEVMSSVRLVCKNVCEPAYRAGTFNSFLGADATREQVVGTGPFMLESYTPGQRLYLKRNPYYHKKDAAGNRLPYLDRMVFTWVQNIDAWMLQFKTGQIDGYALRGSDYPILKPLEGQGDFKIYELGTAMGSAFVAFNQNPGVSPETGKPYVEPHKLKWFRDTRFRQAMAHAIDREGITRTVDNGLSVEQYGPMSAGEGYFYNDKIKPYPRDPKRAKELLTEMGLTDRDGDGLIEDGEGHRVQFTLMTNAGNNRREQIAEIVRKDLANLGMKVDLKFIEFNLLVSKMDETFDWEAMVMAFTGGTEPHLGANIWKSNSRLHLWYPREKRPSTPWEARIDEIFSLAIREMDRTKRKALYDEWQAIVNEQQPLVYTVVPRVLYGFKNKFDNVYPTVLAAGLHQETTWNIEELFIGEGYPLE